ncbi:putative porin [Microbulbifer sp. JMSA004]|uniref:putative porin n=1 Tax=Microbulbifer sp. JMSA004 TaxID=3243370 RepID=UPI00403981C1
MRFKLAALPLMLVATTAGAEEYNSFTNATYANTDYTYSISGSSGSTRNRGYDADDFNLGTTYFFGSKETLGPLKEFEYINKVSNVSGEFYHHNHDSDDIDSFSVGGEYFASNGIVVSAGIYDVWETNLDYQSIGYLFSPDLLVKLNHVDDDSDNEFSLEARYNYQLNSTDYVGFNLFVDEEFENRALSSKYFTHLAGEQYLTVEVAYNSIEKADDYWALGTEFFFNQRTSVEFNYDENENYHLGMTHFFNRNIAVEAAYLSNNDVSGDLDIYQLGLTVQL